MIEAGRSSSQSETQRTRISLATIAELAGVSAPTVSKVLNRRNGVGAETRQRVEDLLREHGFRRRSSERFPSLEVIIQRMLGSVAIEILRGVATVAGEHGHTVTFTDVRHQLDTEAPWIDSVLQRRPAGVITVTAAVSPRYADLLATEEIPLAAIDPIGELRAVPSVGSSNWSGALSATRHLLELGHRRIGVLSGPVKDMSARARLDGFRAALDYTDTPFDDSLARQGIFTFESGLELARQLLDLPDPPTAIVCGNDLQAMGTYEAARQTGRRVPDDLSVIGFDDIDQATWMSPPLTTVRQPFAEMAALAARIVLDLASGKPPAQSRYELDTALIIRGSTAPPPPA